MSKYNITPKTLELFKSGKNSYDKCKAVSDEELNSMVEIFEFLYEFSISQKLELLNAWVIPYFTSIKRIKFNLQEKENRK